MATVCGPHVLRRGTEARASRRDSSVWWTPDELKMLPADCESSGRSVSPRDVADTLERGEAAMTLSASADETTKALERGVTVPISIAYMPLERPAPAMMSAPRSQDMLAHDSAFIAAAGRARRESEAAAAAIARLRACRGAILAFEVRNDVQHALSELAAALALPEAEFARRAPRASLKAKRALRRLTQRLWLRYVARRARSGATNAWS